MSKSRKWLRREKKREAKVDRSRRPRTDRPASDRRSVFRGISEEALAELQQPGLEIHLAQPAGSPRPSPGEIRAMWAEPEAELKAQIDAMTATLRELLDGLPCLQMLSALVVATTFHDPETFRESESHYSAFHTEYPAWHYLSAPTPPRLEDLILDPEATRAAFDVLDGLEASLKSYYTIRAQVAAESPDTIEQAVLMRAAGWNLFVRSPSHEQHNRAQLKALFLPFGEELTGLIGFGVEEAIAAEAGLTQLVNVRINEQRRLMHETVRQWRDALDADPATIEPELQNVIDRLRDTEDPKHAAAGMAARWFESTMHHAFIVTSEELASAGQLTVAVAEKVLRSFSTPFGQPRRANTWPTVEDQLERSPLIDLSDGRWWVGLFAKMQWAIAPRLEAALATSHHWERYQHQHRSRWLEDRAVALIAGDDKRVQRWTRLRYGVDDELDGLVLCGGIAILVETKAGRMTLSARRGAPSVLQSDLPDLLSTPQQQVNRAAKYLLDNEEAAFETSSGQVVVHREQIKRLVHVIVTLDSLSAFVSRPGILAVAGVFNNESLPWCVDINDLIVCAEILGSPARLVHYIDRRMKASRRGVEAPEELDYLGHYLTAQLYFDELDDEVLEVHLTSHTEAMDDFYRYQAGVRKTPAPKPAHKVHPAMEAFIDELEAAAPDNFGEAVFWLLELSTDAQGRLAASIVSRRERARQGYFSAIRYFIGPRLLVYAAMPDSDWMSRLEPYLGASKYAAKATFSIGIGDVVEGSPRFKVDVQYSEWAQDDEADEWSKALLASLRSQVITND
jgi:hypothetical protein